MKIIGIKLEYGNPTVIKNLQPGWFPFGDYQEPTADNHWQYLKKGQLDDSYYLSQMYKSIAAERFPTGMQLSVQCIVGKNGSGKSTLLELYYRIINDFACKCIKEKWIEWKNLPKDIHLEESKGFSAKLFFETDGDLRYLYRNEAKTEYSVIKNGISKILFDSKSQKYDTKHLSEILQSFFYTIANNYSLYSLNPSDYATNKFLDNNNYLEKTDGKWLECIFHKNDGYLTPLVMVPFRDEFGNIDRANEDLLAKQRLSTLAILFESQGRSFLENYHPEQLNYSLNSMSKDYYWNETKETIVSKKAVDLFLSCFAYGQNSKLGEKYNIVAHMIKDILNKLGKGIYGRIRKEWSSYLKEEPRYSNNYRKHNKNVQETICNYLTYKTLKICFTYPTYGKMLLPPDPIIIQSNQPGDLTSAARRIIKSIDTNATIAQKLILYLVSPETASHITLKIRQCLAFVSRNYYKTESVYTQCSINNNAEDSFLYANHAIDKKLYGKEQEESVYKTYEEVFLRMPPAFFDWELFYSNYNTKKRTKNDGDEELSALNKMSSGERHDLVSTSYLMYHLTNLQSVKSDRFRIPYHHINLVFDEVELYFHPEYQRKYLANLLKILSQCHISDEKIRSINIIIVTHSPFILSDVPLSHTLYLENGEAKARNDETFSANIHNLLVNQFFIEQPMGEVAANIIKKIVGSEEIVRKEEYNYYIFIAKKVGDPYISNRLINIIESKTKDTVSLKEEQERLEKRLKEIEYQLSKEDNEK
ncbi:MAG: hypothetical protein VZQ98_15510 [Bacteroidales bacterium]|nr:hypothetical protein [Bacteroidales bacterium]